MSTFIRNIKIKGGVHNDAYAKHYAKMTPDEIELMRDKLAEAIRNVTGVEAWIEVTYTVATGHKINS